MNIIEILQAELEQEANTTRKFLSIVPEDKYDWKPHEKSMSLRQLAAHVAELPGWVSLTLNTDELDFAKNEYKPVVINNAKELLDYYESVYADAKARLATATVEELEQTWTLRSGDQIFSTGNRYDFIRVTYCQTVHHRAQLGVFLRLLNVPIPGSYGPSADDTSMKKFLKL